MRRRPIDKIAIVLCGREYSWAKKHLRHTGYNKICSSDSDEELMIIGTTSPSEGEDPAETWLNTVLVRQALECLDPKDWAVFTGMHVNGGAKGWWQ